MFSSKLVHAVRAREIVVDGAGQWEMYFGIGKVKARFSKHEFCLCTGLRFGQLAHVYTDTYHALNGGVHDRYFGKGDVIAKDLFARFKEGNFMNKDDAVKMALVFFVENILCGRDYRKKISPWLWTLVEDLDIFSSFAWGKYVYQMTVHYLRQGVREPEVGKTKSKYNLYGFPWAFQVGFVFKNN